MRKIVAIVFTVLAILAYLVGFMASSGPDSGPLNYIFVVILGFPWTLLLSWLLGDAVGSPFIPLTGVLINAALLWWWALRSPAPEVR